MMFAGNGYDPFRNAGTAFLRYAPSMVFVGAARCGRPLAVIFRRAVPFPPGAPSFCSPRKKGEKEGSGGGV